ncbi:probable cytochrome P450 313a4 [Chironomus tepperi]|uniref:probable cytochrome P450 313a4 n=1 Tax=Chironomus tepperi TaxID=113505 RepID=UPI00391F8ED4
MDNILKIIFAILSLIYFKFLWKRKRLYKLASKIPGINGIPFLGSVHKFIGLDHKLYLKQILNLFDEFPGLSKVWFGHRLLLLVKTPEDICVILNSPHCNKRPPIIYDALIVRNGLVLANGQIWESHRKVLNQSFSPTNLHKFVSIFTEKSKIYCKKLEDKVRMGEFDIYDFTAGCALETLMKSTLNYDYDFYESKYFMELERLKVLMMKKMFQPWLCNPILFKMTKISREISKHFESTQKFADQIISANHHLKTYNELKNQNVISQLMNSKNNFSYNEIRDEIVTFIGAGHDTTALILSSVILMLAMHKEIQQKVINEIYEIIGSTNESIDVKTLQKLRYLDNVIKEAMRLYPVVPLFARESTDEFVMNGHIIPKGAMLLSSIFNIHRNPKHWGNDAHLFKPERFEDESIKNVHPYAFIPFTGGRRICIGWKYTMLFVSEILPLVFIVVISVYLVFRWKRRRLYELADKIPGQNGYPFIGDMHKLLNPDMRNYCKVIFETCDSSLPLSKGWMGPILTVLTQDPDTIHAIYNSPHCMNKPTMLYSALYSKLGLLSVNGPMYDKHRKIFNRSFKPSILLQLVPVFNEKSLKCIEMLKEQLNQGEFDMYSYTGACSLEVFGAGQLNFEKNFYKSDVLNAFETMKPLMMKKMFRIWLNIEPLYKMSGLYKALQKKYNVLVNFKNQVMEKNSKQNLDEKDEIFVKQLLDKKNDFSDEEIIDEVVIFLLAGYETSALTLSTILMMLAMHKDIQNKCIDEIDQFYEAVDGMIGNESLQNFPYLDLVIKETMRLFTAGGIIGRQTSEEVNLSGYIIPKGTVLGICVHKMHRNPKFWGSDANEFKPERFSPENIKHINPHAYVPFSGGRRICIGYRYAMMFIKIFLIHFFKNYNVSTSLKFEDLEVQMSPTLSIAQGYKLQIHKRS